MRATVLDVRTSLDDSSALITARSQPTPQHTGYHVQRGRAGGYITVDGRYGACAVWCREASNSQWVYLTHGVSEHVCSEVLELLPDAGYPEQYVRLIQTDQPIPQYIERERREGTLDTFVDYDTSTLVLAGVSSVKASSFTSGNALDSTTRYVVLDGRSGASLAWVYDGETTQLAEHGRPILIRGAPQVAPHPSDRTSVVRLWGCSHPVSLPPLIRRVVQKSILDTQKLLVEWFPNAVTAIGGDESFEAVSATAIAHLLVSRVTDGGNGAALVEAAFLDTTLLANTQTEKLLGAANTQTAKLLQFSHTDVGETIYLTIRQLMGPR